MTRDGGIRGDTDHPLICWVGVDPERPGDLDVSLRDGIWGVPEGDRDRIDQLREGDSLLFYHRDHGLLLCEVVSDPYTEHIPVWPDRDYPHRVRISDPRRSDRYTHLGQIHDCFREDGEPVPSAARAESILTGRGAVVRPLTDEEIGCLFHRLGWPRPSWLPPLPQEDVAGKVAPGDGMAPAEQAEEARDEVPEPEEAARTGEEPSEEEGSKLQGGFFEEEQRSAGAGVEASGPETVETQEVGQDGVEEPPASEEPGPEEPRVSEEDTGTQEEQPEGVEPGAEAGEPVPETPVDEEAPPAEADGEAAPEEVPSGESAGEPAPERGMGPRVVLAPATGNRRNRRRFRETMTSGVPVEELGDHLTPEEVQMIRDALPGGRAHVWGASPAQDGANRAQWEAVVTGDRVLFTGGGRVFASARVLFTRRAPELAAELWGRRTDEGTWEFLFFLTPPVGQDIPYAELNAVAGYEPNYRIPRLNFLDEEQSVAVLEAFPGLVVAGDEAPPGGPVEAPEPGAAEAADAPEPVEDTGEQPLAVEPAAAEEAVRDGTVAEGEPEEEPVEGMGATAEEEALAGEEIAAEEEVAAPEEEPEVEPEGEPVEPVEAGPEEGRTGSPDHRESLPSGPGDVDVGRLRRLLFDRREVARCALCGELLPVELISLVFVKPLEACTPAELEDVENDVMPACRMGCAGLFQEGFLAVDEDGRVTRGREGTATDPLEAYMEEVLGNRCEYWHPDSEPFFRWHARRAADGG